MLRRLLTVTLAVAMLALTPIGDAQADPTDAKATTETATGYWQGREDRERTGTPDAWKWQQNTWFDGVWTLGDTAPSLLLICGGPAVAPTCFTGITTSGSWTSSTEEGIIDSINFDGTVGLGVVGSLGGGDLVPAEITLGPDAVGTYRRTRLHGDVNLWELDITTDLRICWGDDDLWDDSCDTAWSVIPVDLDLTAAVGTKTAIPQVDLVGTFTMTSPATGPLVDLKDADIDKPSAECELNGGDRIVDVTSEGVRTALYTRQPSSEEVWVCTRVEDTDTGDGYGGKLVVDSSGADPEISGGGVQSPSTDGDSTACATTSDPPNLVPGSHPIAHGGIGPVDFMVDAYASGQEAWLCLEADSTATRVIVPYDEPVPSVSLGTVVEWHPDQGTPGG